MFLCLATVLRTHMHALILDLVQLIYTKGQLKIGMFLELGGISHDNEENMWYSKQAVT